MIDAHQLIDTDAKPAVASLKTEIDSGTAPTVMQDVIAGVEGFLTMVGLPPQSEAQIASVDAVINDLAKVAASV